MQNKFQLAAQLTGDTKDPLVREVVFYAGTAVPRYDYRTGEMYTLRFSMDPGDVDLSRLKSGAPVIDSHETYSLENVLGVVEDAWLASGKGYARLRFSDREEVAGVVRDVNNGILRNVSMGVAIDALEDITPKGSKVREYLAKGWQPQEISVVAVGADPFAQFLSAYAPSVALPVSAEPGPSREADRARALLAIERELFAFGIQTLPVGR